MSDEIIMGPEPVFGTDIPGLQIWGWMSSSELLWLGETAARMESCAEVGCLHGRSAFALLTACPGLVYCIDPWIGEDGLHDAWPSFWSSCGHFPNLRAIRARSPLVPEFADTVDLTFIDGAHAYESVLADICAWLPHTRKIICGHDYQNADGGYPGVAQAVNEVFGDRVSVAPDTSIWWVNLEMSGRHVAPGLPEGPLTWVDEYDVTSTYDFHWPE